MSMAQHFQPNLPPQHDGIPAADAGRGVPDPAEGFGVSGEEPDAPEQRTDDSGARPSAGTPSEGPVRPQEASRAQ